jgi:hypothetical protein
VKPRFQADNDLRSAIRTGVLRREPSIDFQSARAAGLDGVPDLEVLRVTVHQGRILVSHDENSMPGYFRDFLASGASGVDPVGARGKVGGVDLAGVEGHVSG